MSLIHTCLKLLKIHYTRTQLVYLSPFSFYQFQSFWLDILHIICWHLIIHSFFVRVLGSNVIVSVLDHCVSFYSTFLNDRSIYIWAWTSCVIAVEWEACDEPFDTETSSPDQTKARRPIRWNGLWWALRLKTSVLLILTCIKSKNWLSSLYLLCKIYASLNQLWVNLICIVFHLTLYARSFRGRFFFAYHQTVKHPHTNIILSWLIIPLVLKCAAKNENRFTNKQLTSKIVFE